MIDLKDFKEEYAYVKFRNKSFKNAKVLKGQLIKRFGKNIDASKLYERIVRYQVAKYGTTLCRDYRIRDRKV